MRFKVLILPLFILFTACENESDQLKGRWYSAKQVSHGQELFQQHCSSCHGKQGEGTKEWKKRDPAGNLPPPPLDGTAHTWHHSKELLLSTITEGGAPWQGTMPAFKDQLTLTQKESVIAFIQSLWSDDIYQRWQHLNKN